MAKKDYKKESNDAKQQSKPKEEAPKEPEKDAGPKNPYEVGSKQFLVAKALLIGEVNRGKVTRELEVSLNTIYSVTGELG